MIATRWVVSSAPPFLAWPEPAPPPPDPACARTRPIDNTLRLLRHFQALPRGASLTLPQACRTLGMSHQSGYPIVSKLVEYGYVQMAKRQGIRYYFPAATTRAASKRVTP